MSSSTGDGMVRVRVSIHATTWEPRMRMERPKHETLDPLVGEASEKSHAPSGNSAILPGNGLAEQMANLAPGGGIVQQLEAVRPGSIQDPAAVQRVAQAGVQDGGGVLPHASAIQSAFGHHDIGQVESHVGGTAGAASRAMGAEAYATGNQVAFESAPDLHTAAHEAAHVVQQRAGNSPSGGVSAPGDSLERNADAAADAVVSGRSAEGLLDSVASPDATGGGDAVQCKKSGKGGGGDIYYEEVDEGGVQDMSHQEGSAQVVASAGDTQQAYDASFTPVLVDYMNANPGHSIEELLTFISGEKFDVNEKTDPAEHHATISAYGDPMANRSDGEAPRQMAQLITNQNYKAISKLKTPHTEGGTLAGALAGRGFDMIAHSKDKSAGAMDARYTGRLLDAAQPGDELIAYFAGHGESRGMCGIDDMVGKQDDILPNARIAAITQAAVDKGAHMRFIMDACHSGAAASFVRHEKYNELAQHDASFQTGALGGAALRLDAYKCALVDHCHERENALGMLSRDYNQHLQNDPKDGGIVEKLRFEKEKQSLAKAYHDAKRCYDKQIDEFWTRLQDPLITIVRAITRAHQCNTLLPPASISNYKQLGDQVTYVDYLQNLAIKPTPPRATSGAV